MAVSLFVGLVWQREILLYSAALKGDWAKTEQLANEFPDLIKSTLGFRAETLVHIAVATGNFEYMSNLLNLALRDSVLTSLKDMFGNYPLHVFALAGSYKVAELLMLRCPSLPYYTNHSGKFPQQCIVECGNRQVHLLISTTSNLHPIIQPRQPRLGDLFSIGGPRIDLGANPFGGDNGCLLH